MACPTPSEIPSICLQGQVQAPCGESVYPICVSTELVAVCCDNLKDSTSGGVIIPKGSSIKIEAPEPVEGEDPPDLSVACWQTPECLLLTDGIDGNAEWKITVTACGRQVFCTQTPITTEATVAVEPDPDTGCYDACELSEWIDQADTCPPVAPVTDGWVTEEGPVSFPFATEESEFVELSAGYQLDCDNCLANIDQTAPVTLRMSFNHAVTGGGHLGFLLVSSAGLVTATSAGSATGNAFGNVFQPADNTSGVAWIEYEMTVADLCAGVTFSTGGFGASGGTETINTEPTIEMVTPLEDLCPGCNQTIGRLIIRRS